MTQQNDDKARAFHLKHPIVMSEIARLCFARRRVMPGSTWGVKAAFEVIRHERVLAGLPDPFEEFKINNNYAPWYARQLMSWYPHLSGIFTTREQAA